VPVAAHGDRVVRLGSTSKILASALRVGRLTGPVEVTTAVRDVFDGAVTCSTPTGGMFCWLEFTDGTRTAELLPAALAHGVGFVPGSAFAPAAGPLDHAARLCFASRPAPVLRDAAHRLAAAWREAPPAAT
jgi:2-aminoadipate transaminase